MTLTLFLNIKVTTFATNLRARKTEKNVTVVGIRNRRIVKMIVPRKSCSTLLSALSTRSRSGASIKLTDLYTETKPFGDNNKNIQKSNHQYIQPVISFCQYSFHISIPYFDQIGYTRSRYCHLFF